MNYYKGLIKIGEEGDFKGVPSSLIKAYISDFTLELYTRKVELKKLRVADVISQVGYSQNSNKKIPCCDGYGCCECA